MLTLLVFRGGGIGIKLFGLFLKTDGRSLGLDFPFIFETGKSGGECLTQTTVLELPGILSLRMVFIHLHGYFFLV